MSCRATLIFTLTFTRLLGYGSSSIVHQEEIDRWQNSWHGLGERWGKYFIHSFSSVVHLVLIMYHDLSCMIDLCTFKVLPPRVKTNCAFLLFVLLFFSLKQQQQQKTSMCTSESLKSCHMAFLVMVMLDYLIIKTSWRFYWICCDWVSAFTKSLTGSYLH